MSAGSSPASSRKHVELIGARIKRLRSERKLSQDRLALEANVDQSGLSKFERGRDFKIGRPGVERIARVFGMTYDQLVSGTDFAR